MCGPRSTLVLPAGPHYLTSPGTGLPLTVTDLSLAASPSATRATATARRSLHIGSWGTEYRTATIGAGARSYLEVHQAANARLDGHPERAPARAGDAGRLAAGLRRARRPGRPACMAFTPATGYRRALAGVIAAVCLVIAAAAWPVAAPPDTAVAARGGFARDPAEPDRVLARGRRA